MFYEETQKMSLRNVRKEYVLPRPVLCDSI